MIQNVSRYSGLMIRQEKYMPLAITWRKQGFSTGEMGTDQEAFPVH